MGPAGTPGAVGAPGAIDRPLLISDILFDFDKSDVRASETDKIKAVADFAKQNAGFQIGLDGYADPRGTGGYNQKLSDRRVKAVSDALVAAGVPAGQIRTGAFGEQNRNCTESTEECYQRNRRVEVFVRPGG